MKKIILAALLLLNFNAEAQHEKVTLISVRAGEYFNETYEIESFYKGRLPRSLSINIDKELQLQKTPLFSLDFDKRIKGIVFLGGSASYQYSGISIDDFQQPGFKEDLQVKMHRTSVALKPSFHYFHWRRIELYSGLRLTYQFLSFSDNSANPEFELEEDDFFIVNFTPQLILLGLNVDLAAGLGLNIECAYGEPGYLSAGLVYRLK